MVHCNLHYKKPEATLIKLFIRGKCDDICRASYISDDFTFLFKSLDELYNKLDNFDYWIEDDRNKKLECGKDLFNKK